MELFEILRRKRKELGLTQEEVASSCGVARSTYCRWERGDTKNMKNSNISDLSRTLLIDPAMFILDESEINKYGWQKFFDSANFTIDELKQLEEYGKYIISKRNH